MTDAWKQSVKDKLASNKEAGRQPADQAELARVINVHKTAITKMFRAQSSALVERICVALNIAAPLEAATPEDDDLTRAMREIRKLPAREQAKMLDIIRSFLR